MPRAAPVTTATRPLVNYLASFAVGPGSSGRSGCQAATSRISAAASRSSRARPASAVAPDGSPRTPDSLTARTPPARSSGQISASGRGSPGAALAICTRVGARCSIIDVSVWPACGSPSQAGRNSSTSRDSARSRAVARAAGSKLPPCAQTKTRCANVRLAERPSSTMSSSRASWPMDRVPGKPWCSPLAPYATAGATSTSARAPASRWHSATAMSVSVDSGRCGPCCSVAPSGTASTLSAVTRPPTSGHGRSASSTGVGDEPGQRVRVAGGDRRPGGHRRSGGERERYRAALRGPVRAGPVRVVRRWARRRGGGRERPLAVALDTLGVRAVQRQPGEELRGHAPAAAVSERRARLAGAAGLWAPQPGEKLRVPPHRGEPARVADVPGQETRVNREGAGVHVADGVDQAHDPAGAAQVEPGQRAAVAAEVEERVAGEHVRAMGRQPAVKLALLVGGRVQLVPHVGAAAGRPQPGDPQLGAEPVGDGLELIELADVVPGHHHRDLETGEPGAGQVTHGAERDVVRA